jgi:N-acetylglucosamine-6-phosphate deacetylase
MSTHLGNGAPATLPRHPNYLWEQLAEDRLTTSVIADGHHLPPAVVKCVARVKAPDRLCLVSDAIALGGLPPGLYNERRHDVLPSGKVTLAGTPYLAGAGHLLDTCVASALRFTGWPLANVIRWLPRPQRASSASRTAWEA